MQEHKFRFFTLVLLLFFIVSCSKQTDSTQELMNRAENVIEQYPDSSLKILNSIQYPEDLSKSLFNQYNLLLVRAKDKCYQDITGDTIIFAVKDYYILQKDDRNTAYAAFYCARVLHEQKKGDEAFEAYSIAIDWANKIRDYNLIGLVHSNLSILYREHSLYEEAMTASKAAVEMYRKAGNYKNEIAVLSQIGDCLLLEHKADSAFLYYDEAIKLADQYSLTDMQSSVRQNKGVAYRKEGDNESAKRLFREALAFTRDSTDQARTLMNMAQVFLLENHTDPRSTT